MLRSMLNVFLPSLLVAASTAGMSVAQKPDAPAPAAPAGAQGEEVIQPSPYSFIELKHEGSVSVFESVPTAVNLTQKRLYLSPICRIVPLDAKGKLYEVVALGNGRSRLQLQMLYYYDDLFTQAIDRINVTHKTNFKPDQLSLMPVIGIKHELASFPSAAPATIGKLDGRVGLPNAHVIEFDVPDTAIPTIERLAASPGGIKVESTLYYNSTKLLKKVISWTSEDVRGTDSFKKLDQAGGAFVSAQQVQDVVQEIMRKQNVIQIEDPGAPAEFDKAATAIFDKLTGGSLQLIVDSAEKAKEADEHLRRATGMSSKDFMPVQLDYEYTEEVLNAKDVKQANLNAKKFRERVQTQLSVSAKGSYGPVSGKASYSKSTDRTDEEEFRDEKEFYEKQKKHRNEAGKGVRFEARGIGLVEKGHFRSNISVTASQVAIRPVNELGKITIPSSTSDGLQSLARLPLTQWPRTVAMKRDGGKVDDGGGFHSVTFKGRFDVQQFSSRGYYFVEMYEVDERGRPTGANRAFVAGSYATKHGIQGTGRLGHGQEPGDGVGHIRNSDVLIDKDGVTVTARVVVFDAPLDQLKQYGARLWVIDRK